MLHWKNIGNPGCVFPWRGETHYPHLAAEPNCKAGIVKAVGRAPSIEREPVYFCLE